MNSHGLRLRRHILSAIILTFGFSFGHAFGQGTTSRVTGTALDAGGAAVAGATVTLTNEGTNVSFTTETTATGTYAFDSVQVGTYTVSVEQSGFKKFVSNGNTVNISTPTTVNITLEVGDVSEAVTVSASNEIVQTSTSGNIGNVVEQSTLESLPIVGDRGRNPLSFINFQPGVTPTANTGGGVHVHGARDRAFNFTLDGIDINETSAGGSNFTPIRANPDSISQFQVVTSNFTADSGRSSGAQVTLVTRSGTNEFHGNLFEFYQTPRFNATEYVNTIQRVGKPQYVQHIFGGSFGGPVYLPRFGEGGEKYYSGKNKTFFFTNLQLLRTSQSFFVNRTVYTAQARAGIYRYIQQRANGNALSSTPSVDTSGNVLPNLTPLSYNVYANSGGLGPDPTTANLIGLTPLPNNYLVGDGLNTAGFAFVAPQTERQYDWSTKIDHTFNESNSVFVRWSQGAQNTLGDNANAGLQRFPNFPNFVDTYRTPRNLAVNYRATLSPTMVNEFVVGFNRFTFSFDNPDPNANPNVILNNVTDPLNLNEPVNNLRTITTYQIVDNLSYLRNAHIFKFGTNLRFQKHVDDRSSVAGFITRAQVLLNTAVNPVPTSFGTNNAAIVPGLTTAARAADRARLDNYINDLLGRVGQINQGFVAVDDNNFGSGGTRFLYDARYPEYDFYGQDTWKARSNLTFDLGLRWEMRLSPRAPNNIVLRPEQRLALEENPTNSFRFGEGKLYDDSLFQFAPSVGVAWDPFESGKTSIRANYRLAYDRTNTFLFSSFIFQSAPGLTRPVINNIFGNNGGLLRQGVPTLTSSDRTPQQFRQPDPFSVASLNVVDPDLKYPRTHQYSVNFQRELAWKTVLDVSYIGRQGRNLFGGYDANQVDITNNNFLNDFNELRNTGNNARINALLLNDSRLNFAQGSTTVRETGSAFLLRQAIPSTVTTTNPVRLANGTTTAGVVASGSVSQAAFLIAQGIQRGTSSTSILTANGFSPYYFQKYPQFGGAVNVIDSNDRSRYNALEIQLSRRFSDGAKFQISYTLAKSEDTRSFDPAFTIITRGGTGQSAGNTPFNNFDRDLNYALSDFDRRHAVQGTVELEAPWGRGRRFGRDWNQVTDFFLGGINLAGVGRWYSGRPFTVFSGVNTLSQVVFTPASCNNCSPDMGEVVLERGTNFFFTEAQRAQFYAPEPGQFSNVGRNYFIGPRLFQLDMSLFKRFRFNEATYFELRFEAQNVTNTPSFAVADGNLLLNSNNFGQILGTTVTNARRVQLGAKFYF